MNLQLEGKVALVTGSTAGIGFSIAKQLLEEGATVYINGRTEQRIHEAIKKLQEAVPGANVHGIAADFLKVEEVNRLLKELPEVDILINNAGIFEPKPFAEITDDDWFRFYEMNVLSGVRLSRQYMQRMLKKNWGRIIFISSESAIHILPGPTRSEGVEDFIENLAQQQQQSKEEVEKDFFKTARPTSLIRRFATTDEIANLVTYLSSPLSAATNGAALRADGGLVKTIV